MLNQRILLLFMMVLWNFTFSMLGQSVTASITGQENITEINQRTESTSVTSISATPINTLGIIDTTNDAPMLSTTSPPMTTSTQTPDNTTTTTSTTSPPPSPSPYPEPSVGQWNSSCVMVKMAAQLNIIYETKDKKTCTTLYNIPTSAKYYDGQCKPATQTIHINWGPPDAQGSMLLEFDLKNQTVQLTMMHFVIPIVGDRFPNAMENQTVFLLHIGKNFASPVKKSYHCTRSQYFNLTETLIDPKIVGTIAVHDVQVEAFRSSTNSNTFSPAKDCESNAYSGIIPIAVGIALVGMILIIFIAYCFARRHSTSQGYMSF